MIYFPCVCEYTHTHTHTHLLRHKHRLYVEHYQRLKHTLQCSLLLQSSAPIRNCHKYDRIASVCCLLHNNLLTYTYKAKDVGL